MTFTNTKSTKITKFIKPIATGSTKAYDGNHPDRLNRNNCSVRALSNCAGIDYEEAHDALKQAGRIDGQGTTIEVFYKAYQPYMQEFFTVGNTNDSKYFTHAVKELAGKYPEHQKGCTLGTFIKEHQEGTYAVLVEGHILSVIDGYIVDTLENNKNLRVSGYFVF
jgi:hypothetical protein